ncbi:MAG: hypothetical protein WCO84_08490 [bacterium]
MSGSEPTQEELEALLTRMGVASGEWKDSEGGPTHLPFVKPQLDNLTKLRDHFVGMVEADNQVIAQLREQVIRLQRGGGS